MALTFTDDRRAVELAQTGIAVTLVPSRDPDTKLSSGRPVEIQRAPDSSGSPNEGAATTIVKLPALDAAGIVYVDPRPLTTSRYWYRFRHTLGAAVGDWSSWIGPLEAVELTRETLAELRRGPGTAAPLSPTLAQIGGQSRSIIQALDRMVPNAEFDLWANANTLIGWTVTAANSSGVARDTSIKFSGDESAKYTFGAGGAAGDFQGIATDDPTKGAFCVPLRPGSMYRIRVASRADDVANAPTYKLKATFNVAGSLTDEKIFTYAASDTWQLDEWIFKVPSGAEAVSKLEVLFKRGATTALDFWVDALRIEEVEFRIRNAADTAGILVDGTLSGGWTRYLNLTGTGTFLKHDKLELLYDGTALFKGHLDVNQPVGKYYLRMRDADVAHGMTVLEETDVFGAVGIVDGNAGGMEVLALRDAAGTAFDLIAVTGATPSAAVIMLSPRVKSGTGATNLAADDIGLEVNSGGGSAARILGFGRMEAGMGGAAAGNRGTVPVCLYDNGDISHTGTTSETTIDSVTLPANALNNAGSKLRITGMFEKTVGTSAITVRVKIGGTIVLTITGSTAAGDEDGFTVEFGRRLSNAQHFQTIANVNGTLTGSTGTAAVDLTTGLTVAITMQLAASNNTERLDWWNVEVIAT